MLGSAMVALPALGELDLLAGSPLTCSGNTPRVSIGFAIGGRRQERRDRVDRRQ